MAPEKIEALLITDSRSFKYSKIVFGEHEVGWRSRSIKCLRVQLDRRLIFVEHLQIAINKVIQCRCNMAWIMPNIGGPRKAKRRLVASGVHSKLLCAALIWASALGNHAVQKRLLSILRDIAMWIFPAYRSVSTSTVLVLASVLTIDLLAKERQEALLIRKGLNCLNNEQEIVRAKKAICKDIRRRFVERWKTRCHGE